MKLNKGWIVAALIVSVFALSHFAREFIVNQRGESEHVSEVRESSRIVSMAPSSCEVLYEIGLGDDVVGVSRFTTYPPEAVGKAKIGGYLDVDIEALVRLQPDVVVLLKEQQTLATQLEGMGMGTVLVDHMSVDGIMNSMRILGDTFHASEASNKARALLEERISKVEKQAQSEDAKTVLLSIGREFGHGKVNSLVAAGAAGYHQELLELANLENAYTGSENFPQLTREHILTLDPDVIIDMVNSKDAESIGVEKICADWMAHSELKAVQNGTVYILVGDKHFVPGPRFIDTLEWIHATTRGGNHE